MAFILFDEHLGQVHPAGEVRFPKATATIRDLIRARVELEVERTRDEAGDALASKLEKLIVPGPVEQALNGDRGAYGLGAMFMRVEGDDGSARLDRLIANAEEGFSLGRYFILFDQHQAEGLDEVIDLDRTGEATFLLLTPLQGG